MVNINHTQFEFLASILYIELNVLKNFPVTSPQINKFWRRTTGTECKIKFHGEIVGSPSYGVFATSAFLFELDKRICSEIPYQFYNCA